MGTGEDYDRLYEDAALSGEDPGSIRDSAGELPSQIHDACSQVASGDLDMTMVTNDGKSHIVKPDELELNEGGEAGFIAKHKGVVIGVITVAGVLAGVTTIALRRRRTE